MKKIISLALSILLSLSIVGCSSGSESAQALKGKWESFSGYGVTVEYPADWTLYSLSFENSYTEKAVLVVSKKEKVFIRCYVSKKKQKPVADLYPCNEDKAEEVRSKIEASATLQEGFPTIPDNLNDETASEEFLIKLLTFNYMMEDSLPAYTGTLPSKETKDLGKAQMEDDGSLAAAKDYETDSWGYVTRNGDWAIEPMFDSAAEFSEGLAFVTTSQGGMFIDRYGEVAIGEVSYAGEGTYTMINSNGFVEGLALVELDKGQNINKVYIDKTGTVVVDAKAIPMPQGVITPTNCFALASDFRNGYAVVMRYLNSEAGYFAQDYMDTYVIDTSGQIVTTIQGSQYSTQGSLFNIFNHGLDPNGLIEVADINTKLIGQIDVHGNLVIPCQFERLFYAGEGLYQAYQNNKNGYLDQTGKVVVDFIYNSAYSFGDGLAIVSTDGISYGCIDKSGKMVIPAEYDDIYLFNYGSDAPDIAFSDGVVGVLKDGYWGLIDTNGKLIIDYVFEDNGFRFESASHGVLCYTNGEYNTAADQALFGIISKEGKIIKEPCFKILYPFYDAG